MSCPTHSAPAGQTYCRARSESSGPRRQPCSRRTWKFGPAPRLGAFSSLRIPKFISAVLAICTWYHRNVIQLDTPVQFVKGIGPQIGKTLAEKRIVTVEDLLLHL